MLPALRTTKRSPKPWSNRISTGTRASPASSDVVARITEAGATSEEARALGLVYPSDLFSLSHVAVPFPVSDGVYGMEPDPSEDFGINFGAMAARGERGTLIVSLDFVSRTASNPFFPYLLERIESGIGDRHGGANDLR